MAIRNYRNLSMGILQTANTCRYIYRVWCICRSIWLIASSSSPDTNGAPSTFPTIRKCWMRFQSADFLTRFAPCIHFIFYDDYFSLSSQVVYNLQTFCVSWSVSWIWLERMGLPCGFPCRGEQDDDQGPGTHEGGIETIEEEEVLQDAEPWVGRSYPGRWPWPWDYDIPPQPSHGNRGSVNLPTFSAE